MATFLANEINATERDVTGPTEQVQIMFPLRRLERVFRCCSVCETMEDYKEGYFNSVDKLYISSQLYCWAIL